MAEENGSFADLGLQDDIVGAVTALGLEHPTPVQLHSIPLALKGHDVLARAQTGSGKTLAFVLPLLQRLLREKRKKKRESSRVVLRAAIVTPSRELCTQVAKVVQDLLRKLKKGVAPPRVDTVFDIASSSSTDAEKVLHNQTEIVVTTPGCMVHSLTNSTVLDYSEIVYLAVDEADSVLASPTAKLSVLKENLPRCQTFLASATLSPDVLGMKKEMLNKPYLVKVEEEDDLDKADKEEGPAAEGEVEEEEPVTGLELVSKKERIAQTFMSLTENDKFTALIALLQYNHCTGRTLVFVNSVTRALKVNLFLDSFSIQCAVLSAEMPELSRQHTLDQFNNQVYRVLVATDESAEWAIAKAQASEEESKSKKKKGKGGSGQEFGLGRGIDFKCVRAVINFDLPSDGTAYTHRIGRCARGYEGKQGRRGVAISFVQKDSTDEPLWESISQEQRDRGRTLHQHPLKEGEISKIRYRANDIRNSLKPQAIKEARQKLIAKELLNSEKLRERFSENPQDLATLQQLSGKKLVENSIRVGELPYYIKKQVDIKKRKRSEDVGGEGGPKRKKQRRVSGKVLDPLKSGNLAGSKRAASDLKGLDLKLVDRREWQANRKKGKAEARQKRMPTQKKKSQQRAAEHREKKRKSAPAAAAAAE